MGMRASLLIKLLCSLALLVILALLLTSKERGEAEVRITSSWPARAPLKPPQLDEEDGDSPTAIRRDMEQCSGAMGMSRRGLEQHSDSLQLVSEWASQFVSLIHSVVPRVFSSSSSSPCWLSNITLTDAVTEQLRSLFIAELDRRPSPAQEKALTEAVFGRRHSTNRFLCLPVFFLAGFPKSGTTSLYHALSSHPLIVSPRSKEPHFWSRMKLEDHGRDFGRLAVVSYLTNFIRTSHDSSSSPSSSSSSSPILSFDGSQDLLWDSNFFHQQQDYCAQPAVVRRVVPNARFIVLMRNPVARTYSHYLWSCSYALGNDVSQWPAEVQRDASGHFHREIEKDIHYFRSCLNGSSLFECTNAMRHLKHDSGQFGEVGFRLSIGLYYVHLSKWLQFFPKENFLLLRTEDMERAPSRLMDRITTFLGIPSLTAEESERLLGMKRNAQKAVSVTSQEYAMSRASSQLLEEFYAPYNELLAGLAGDTGFLWKD